MLGLSFKPETDDMREAPSIDIVAGLEAQGASVRAFDPVANDAARKLIPNATLCEDAYEACEEADVLVLMTEWNQFRMLDLERIKSLLSAPVVVDLRNVYEPERMREAGFRYVCVGR
jgi:UDPglucose 6-dehydrogenase